MPKTLIIAWKVLALLFLSTLLGGSVALEPAARTTPTHTISGIRISKSPYNATRWANNTDSVSIADLHAARSTTDTRRGLTKREQLYCKPPPARGPATHDDCHHICWGMANHQGDDTILVDPMEEVHYDMPNCKWALLNIDMCGPHAMDYRRLSHWCLEMYYTCILVDFDAVYDLVEEGMVAYLEGIDPPPPYAEPSPCEAPPGDPDLAATTDP